MTSWTRVDSFAVPLPIEVDTERPDAIVVVTFKSHVSDDEFQAYLQRLTDRLALQKPFGFVFVAESGGTATAVQRRMQAAWIRDHFNELRRWVWAASFVLHNPIGRLTLASVLALQRLPYPHVVVATIDQAFAWVNARRNA
jgi:hypothetical protein